MPCPLLMHIISLISQRDLRGHIGEITTLQFFPSGQGMQYKKERRYMMISLIDCRTVLLSGATDFQLKIWSILDGSNPVTLKGHTAS